MMIQLTITDGLNELANSAGIQVRGNKNPDEVGGLSPRELIEGAVALCTSITLEAVLKRDGIDYNPDEIKIQVVASKEEGVKNRFTHFDVKLTLPQNLEESYHKKLLKVVERGCTVSNTIINGASVTLATE